MPNLKKILFFCLTFCAASCTTPMDSKPSILKSETFSVVERRLTNVQIWLPENYNRNKSYDLAVIFHGRGGNSLQAYKSYFPQHPDNLVCIGLDAPYNDSISDGTSQSFSYFPYSLASDKESIMTASDSISDTIIEAIEKAKIKFTIRGKVSFIGFSQGATFALYTAMRYPGSTNNLILGSGIYSEIIPENYEKLSENNLNLHIFHGNADMVVPLNESQTLARKTFMLNPSTDFSKAIGHVVDDNFQSFVKRALRSEK